jgi:hypothetical protein
MNIRRTLDFFSAVLGVEVMLSVVGHGSIVILISIFDCV